LSTKVTIKHGKVGKYEYHVYHDVFDEETVFLETHARHVQLTYNEESGMIVLGLHKDVAREMGVISEAEYQEVDLKLPPVGDSTGYKCVNGHDECGNMYPGPQCPYCEVRR